MPDRAIDPTLWYFAYGSNVDPRTFLGRRGMRPHEACVAQLEDYELRFDLPIGPGERGVANVGRRAGSRIWGMAYRLTLADAARLDRTEGVHRGFYRRVTVAPRTREGLALSAFTYHSPRGRAGRKPSRRYLGLLLSGARHHGLPAEWMEHLRGLPLARDERDRQLPLL